MCVEWSPQAGDLKQQREEASEQEKQQGDDPEGWALFHGRLANTGWALTAPDGSHSTTSWRLGGGV